MKRSRLSNLSAISLFLLTFFISPEVFAQDLTPAWALNFGGNISEIANSVKQTDDGGYIVAGAGYLITKLDFRGTVEWHKEYLSDFNDVAHCIEPTQGGGFIAAGTSSSDYNDRIWIIKLDASGNIDWQKLTHSENSGFRSRAYSVKETIDQDRNPDGYIVVGGTIHLNRPSWEIWILKLNLDGTINWQKTYGLATAGSYCIEQTFGSSGDPDGFIVAGSNNYYLSQAWLLRIDQDGNVIWDRIYGGSPKSARSVKQTMDGGFIVAGQGATTDPSSGLAPGRHFWVAKLDPDGSIDWTNLYGGPNGEDVLFSVQEVLDSSDTSNGYIVAGETANFGAGRTDVWIIKLDDSGNIEWEKTYGGSLDESAQSIQQTFDQTGHPSGYTVAGETWSYGTGRDAFVLKLNAEGEIPNCDLVNDSIAIVFAGEHWFYQDPPVPSVEVSSATVIDTTVTPSNPTYQAQLICYTDSIAISKCNYNSDPDNTLMVKANSTDEPDAVLSAEVEYVGGGTEVLGDLFWRADRNEYVRLFRDVTQDVATVTVTSDHNGSDVYHLQWPGPDDTVTIDRTWYNPAPDNTLMVIANSTDEPDAVLSVEVEYAGGGTEVLGDLIWRADRDEYVRLFRNVTIDVATVTVTSSHGGSDIEVLP